MKRLNSILYNGGHMETKLLRLSAINPAPYNPRKPLKQGDREWDALNNSIDKFGLVEPLIVNKRTNNLVGGHQRYNVLRSKGVTEAECVIVDVDDQQERLLNIALNKIEGDWDYEKLDELFQTMNENDIIFSGFSEDEVGDLFGTSEPEFGEESEGWDEHTTGTPEAEDKPATGENEGFTVYLSFPTRAAATGWLLQRNLEAEFEETRNVTVNMVGDKYDRED